MSWLPTRFLKTFALDFASGNMRNTFSLIEPCIKQPELRQELTFAQSQLTLSDFNGWGRHEWRLNKEQEVRI